MGCPEQGTSPTDITQSKLRQPFLLGNVQGNVQRRRDINPEELWDENCECDHELVDYYARLLWSWHYQYIGTKHPHLVIIFPPIPEPASTYSDK